ncbi:hypothetical protein ASPZODRAFT_127388 [Penicilliopsis zonata CBS 506.65]|uniref:Uncharacterized protein n=1 Tax=Penicilliopsis zonata CBS 506.65 TaxID=1073090 RepID=A0A1L9SVV9_9EURO|nr:hypothetical protein ASPZODRAFT_127388 [Penicilliopsis zonata CBS 506.65]OJJ51328.1 hypothetical protein ASPZODRAFT_127388 [Penicilliopsis zonata CBS 506.65]
MDLGDLIDLSDPPDKTSPPVRPTNIPPPSVLLQLFPRVFDELQQAALRAKAIPGAHAEVEKVAESIRRTLKVVARVVAGRTARWKRDTFLSQSMRIGPARPGGKTGGMKLSSVNKSESVKEQQEAGDLLQLWRDRTAVFNSAVLSAGKRPVPPPPDDARAIIAPGALKAAHACALCGLKREERLTRTDEQVEDSFGEWWTEHWGHRDCQLFWDEYKQCLDQR